MGWATAARVRRGWITSSTRLRATRPKPFALTESEGDEAAADGSRSTEGRLKALESLRPWSRLVFAGERHAFNIPQPDELIIHKRLTIYGSAVVQGPEPAQLCNWLV